MSLAEQIIEFYRSLYLNKKDLPENVDVLNTYANASDEVWGVIESFYTKYYSDSRPRGLILGINPGRFGAGATGIPFTDSYTLQEHCDIEFPGSTRETSAAFVYMVIEAYGGAEEFYRDWFIGAGSPLGFVKLNDKGNWVNWNYYDEKSLFQVLRPFINEKLVIQTEICSHPNKAIVLGNGKNYKFLGEVNKDLKLFDQLIPLEHPRYIMQYKRRFLDQYVAKFVETLRASAPH